MPRIPAAHETILGAMTWYRVVILKTWNHVMTGLFASDSKQIDRRTTRSICDAVGERLQQNLRPEPGLPTHLERLLNELEKREREGSPH